MSKSLEVMNTMNHTNKSHFLNSPNNTRFYFDVGPYPSSEGCKVCLLTINPNKSLNVNSGKKHTALPLPSPFTLRFVK